MDGRSAGRGDRALTAIAYRYAVASLLMLAYTLNSADRTLIAIIGQPLKVDLKLSDTQLGLLVGPAFAALYAFSGIPIARLAERFNRVNIIFLVMTLWSGLTALCGFTTSFAQLLLLRVGVGFGEAGCTPPAHSLLSDYFDATRRATALSIYSCGISLGYVISAMLGGYVALHYGWRAACLVVGLPGVLIAVIIKRYVKEPPRGAFEARRAHAWLRGEFAELTAVARTLFSRWPTANIILGVIIASFASQGCWAFVPAFFNRGFQLDYATIGVVTGLTGGVAVGVGLLCGGFLADALGRRSAKWYALLPAIALIVGLPLYVGAFLQSDWRRTAVLLGAGGFFQYISFGPTFGVIQNVVAVRRRATATALVYVLLSVVALAGGALFTGWLIDHFAQFNFNHAGADTMAKSFALMRSGPASGAASFQLSCPGGESPATGGAVLQGACRATLALSSRQGILVTALLYGWAALHYALGAIGLATALKGSNNH
ncbi:MAG: spinster family MFS transporter [Steroidobacteraceae bacterium]